MAKPRMTARHLWNGLSGVRRSARRECDEGISNARAERIEIKCFAGFADEKIDGTAADRAADLRIGRTLVAILVMRQRLL